jgi:hypothetical protein
MPSRFGISANPGRAQRRTWGRLRLGVDQATKVVVAGLVAFAVALG